MLVLSRKIDETIEIRPRETAGGQTLAEVFAQGGIRVRLVRISPTRVQLAIEAPHELEIRRGGPVNVRHSSDEADPSAEPTASLSLAIGER